MPDETRYILKRIVLIHPNYRNIYKYVSKSVPLLQPPMGIAYIAAALREKSHLVSIIDGAPFDLDNREIAKRAIAFSPDLIGISATTNLIETAAEIAYELKKRSEVPIVIGGSHSSIMPEKTLEEFPSFDMAVKGEGEYLMLDLCEGIEKNKISGLTYRESNKIIRNIDRSPIEVLDKLPFPARDLLPNKKYWTPGTGRYPYANILTSRGCPYSCTFCSDHLIHGRKFRARSVENVMREVDFLVREYHIKELNIIDDNFTLIPERVEKFCNELLKRKYNLIWRISQGVRPDKVTKDLLKLMKKSGCYFIAFGIESGDDEILKIMKKGLTTEQIKRAVNWTRELGIHTFGFFIIGNLGENRKKIEKTINFAKELKLDDVQFLLCLPFPGTEIYDRVVKEGKLLIKHWQNYAAYDSPTFTHKELTPELLKEMQVEAYRSYYLRPKIIVRKIFEIKSIRQLLAYFMAGLGILKMKKR